MRKKTIVAQITEEIESHKERFEALAPHLEMDHVASLALETLQKILDFIDESSLVDEEVQNIKGAYSQGREDEKPDTIVKYVDETDYFNKEYKH